MLILIMPSILSVSRSGSKVFMGRGGGRKGSCRTSRARSPKPLTAGVQGPLKGPGSSRGCWCLLVLSEPYFKVFWYNMGFKKNIVDHILGGRTPVAPPPPPLNPLLSDSLLWAKRITPTLHYSYWSNLLESAYCCCFGVLFLFFCLRPCISVLPSPNIAPTFFFETDFVRAMITLRSSRGILWLLLTKLRITITA